MPESWAVPISQMRNQTQRVRDAAQVTHLEVAEPLRHTNALFFKGFFFVCFLLALRQDSLCNSPGCAGTTL